jgi:hypothetical protein
MRVAHLALVALSEKQVGPLPRVGSRSRFESVERVKFRERMRDNESPVIASLKKNPLRRQIATLFL